MTLFPFYFANGRVERHEVGDPPPAVWDIRVLDPLDDAVMFDINAPVSRGGTVVRFRRDGTIYREEYVRHGGGAWTERHADRTRRDSAARRIADRTASEFVTRTGQRVDLPLVAALAGAVADELDRMERLIGQLGERLRAVERVDLKLDERLAPSDMPEPAPAPRVRLYCGHVVTAHALPKLPIPCKECGATRIVEEILR